jgi:hypothetical protein
MRTVSLTLNLDVPDELTDRDILLQTLGALAQLERLGIECGVACLVSKSPGGGTATSHALDVNLKPEDQKHG